MNSSEYFEAGQLGPALDAALADVKKEPTNVRVRYFLCELLCFSGQWERADKQLDTMAQQDPANAVHATIFRQLIRGEMARQEVFNSGRAPQFVAEPSLVLTAQLQALLALREGNFEEAATKLAEAEQQREACSGVCDGAKFDDLLDADDLTASFFEVITAAGHYYWVPFDAITTVKFEPPKRPRDLIWRPAHIEPRGGEIIDGFVPALYAATCESEDDQLRLGRATHWTDQERGVTRGCGLRLFLVGEEGKSVLEINQLRFDAHA